MSVNVATARSATSIAGACESTRIFLEGLADPVAAEATDTVILVVSELVTNANYRLFVDAAYNRPEASATAS